MADQIFNVNSGFYDAIDLDRLYSADQMNRPYKRIISNGVFATPEGTASTDLQVTAASGAMDISVAAGEGLFGDKWFENPSTITITVPSNTAATARIDSVIIQVDNRSSGRVGSIIYRTGTASSSPSAPALDTSEDVYEYRVANIYVASSANTINDDAITDLRGSSECPWVTSLIYQVDTSTLWSQWQAAYEAYYAQSTADWEDYEDTRREEWEQFFADLTEDLTVSTNMLMLTNEYVSTESVSTISIGIASYNPDTDILQVFVNGLRALEDTQYTVNSDGTSITLTTPIETGQTVQFVVFKSIITGDIDTAVTLIKSLDARLSNFMADSGWINFTLESGATSYDSTTIPAVRCVGNRVYLRGAIKGITSLPATICTLPVAYRPAMAHQYTTAAISGTTVNDTVVIEITTEGLIRLIATSGTLSSSDEISIATNFAIESEASSGETASLVVSDDGNGNVVLTHS